MGIDEDCQKSPNRESKFLWSKCRPRLGAPHRKRNIVPNLTIFKWERRHSSFHIWSLIYTYELMNPRITLAACVTFPWPPQTPIHMVFPIFNGVYHLQSTICSDYNHIQRESILRLASLWIVRRNGLSCLNRWLAWSVHGRLSAEYHRGHILLYVTFGMQLASTPSRQETSSAAGETAERWATISAQRNGGGKIVSGETILSPLCRRPLPISQSPQL